MKMISSIAYFVDFHQVLTSITQDISFLGEIIWKYGNLLVKNVE